MIPKQSYDIHLDDKFGQLAHIDVAAHEPWFNQTLTSVNDAVVRRGVIEGDFHWHKHDEPTSSSSCSADSWSSTSRIATASPSTQTKASPSPGAVVHRTRAPHRTSILMIEAASVVPTGD